VGVGELRRTRHGLSGRPGLCLLGERLDLEVFLNHVPAPAARGVSQVLLAYQGRVAPRLIGREMCHQTAVAEGAGVAVHDEHASPRSGQGHHLAQAIFAAGVATQQAGLATARAALGSC
jgi:hypothetical protein